MVVVLIIGILIAIALPTFLGARKRSQDRAAQSNARSGFSNAKVVYTDTDSYIDSATMLTKLNAAEPALQWSNGVSGAANVVSVNVPGAATNGVAANQIVGLAALSDSGTCFLLVDYEATPTNAGGTAGVHYGDTATAANCDGTHAISGITPTAANDSPQDAASGW